MNIIGTAALALAVACASPGTAGGQQLDSARRDVWQSVEARWRAWQAGDLDRMLRLYHPRFHTWNRVSGALDGRDSLLARWRRALQSETILAVRLEPIAVERYGDFATAFYVSRDTVRVTSTAVPPAARGALPPEPSVVTIRWSDYLVRDGGRWLFVGYGGVPCSPSEAPGSACRAAPGK